MADIFGSNYANALNAIAGVGNNYANRQAGSALASGNYKGAANTLLQNGDLQTGLAVQDRGQAVQDKASAQQIDFTLKVARTLKGVKQSGGNVLEAYQSFAPVLLQMQVPPDQIAQIGTLLQQDPNAIDHIEEWAGQQKQELEFRTVGKDAIAIDKATGKEVQRYRGEGEQYTLAPGSRRYDAQGNQIAETPFAPQYRAVGEGQSLVEVNPSAPQAPAAPVGDVSAMEQAVLQIPGTVVTGGPRSAEHNAEIPGSVPNSYHIPTAENPTGLARDFRIPQGATAEQFAAQVRQQVGPGWQVIAEPNAKGGPHVHVEPSASPTGGGARVVAQGAPKAAAERWRLASPDEVAQAGLPPGTPAQISPQGELKPFANGANMKPVPQRIVDSIIGNRSAIAKVDAAIQAIEANPNGMGASNYTPGPIRDRLDKGGVDVRAKVSGVSATKVHDLSGAAVSPKEFDRLSPYIPQITDPPDVAITKLKNFKAELQSVLEEHEGAYGPDSGYRPLNGTLTDRPSTSQSPAAQASTVKPARLAPALWATASPPQQQYWSANPPSGSLGGKANPIRVNPKDPNGSYANVPVDAFFLTPNGEVWQKKARPNG